MQFHIGLNINSPSSYLNRYSQRTGKVNNLSSGNQELEFIHNNECRVWFEVSNTTNNIIGWRFIGNKETCRIVP